MTCGEKRIHVPDEKNLDKPMKNAKISSKIDVQLCKLVHKISKF